MRKSAILLLLLFVSASLLGCGGMKTTKLAPDSLHCYRPLKEVAIENCPPSQPHKVLANWQCVGKVGSPHYNCFADLKRRAAYLDADALVVAKAGVAYSSFGFSCPYVRAAAIKYINKSTGPRAGTAMGLPK